MTCLRLTVLLLAALASLASTLNPEEPPEIDDCASPTTTGATAVAIGAANEDQFRPLLTDSIADFVAGGQGNDMLPLRFQVTGLVEGCVSHETRLSTCDPMGPCDRDNRTEIARSVTALRTYGAPATTAVHFVILEGFPVGGAPVFVESRVGGLNTEVVLWHRTVGTLEDGGPAADAGL